MVYEINNAPSELISIHCARQRRYGAYPKDEKMFSTDGPLRTCQKYPDILRKNCKVESLRT